MIFSFAERPGSRAYSQDPPSFSMLWIASGETDGLYVSNYARSATPTVVSTAVGILQRQNISVSPAGFGLHEVTVTYGKKKNEAGSYSFSFDTTGATVKIKVAKEHVASYPAGEPSNQHNGAIGVTQDMDVEGADIVIPALKLNVNYRHPQGIVTMTHARNLARATGKTNAYPFMGFAAGELLFLGASGSDGSETEAELAYQFAASENVTGLTIGSISGIAKKGWEYAWVEFKNDEASGLQGTQPRKVHIERIYDAISFADTFGWS